MPPKDTEGWGDIYSLNSPLRDTEKGLYFDMWMSGVPDKIADRDFVRDVKTILQEKLLAWEAFSSRVFGDPKDPESLVRKLGGGAFARAQRLLWRHFSGERVNVESAFQPRGLSPAHYSEYKKFVSSIDWDNPLPSIWEEGGPLQESGREAAERVKSHIASRVIGYTGYGHYPGIEEGEGIGVAMLGAMERFSNIPYDLARNFVKHAITKPSEAALTFEKNIKWGIESALSRFNAGARDIEENESYVLNSPIGESALDEVMDVYGEREISAFPSQEIIPPHLEEYRSQPASDIFPKFGELNEEQRAALNAVMRRYLGIEREPTVDDAVRLLHVKQQAREVGFYNLSDDDPARFLLQGSKHPGGLENVINDAERRIRRSGPRIDPEASRLSYDEEPPTLTEEAFEGMRSIRIDEEAYLARDQRRIAHKSGRMRYLTRDRERLYPSAISTNDAGFTLTAQVAKIVGWPDEPNSKQRYTLYRFEKPRPKQNLDIPFSGSSSSELEEARLLAASLAKTREVDFPRRGATKVSAAKWAQNVPFVYRPDITVNPRDIAELEQQKLALRELDRVIYGEQPFEITNPTISEQVPFLPVDRSELIGSLNKRPKDIRDVAVNVLSEIANEFNMARQENLDLDEETWMEQSGINRDILRYVEDLASIEPDQVNRFALGSVLSRGEIPKIPKTPSKEIELLRKQLGFEQSNQVNGRPAQLPAHPENLTDEERKWLADRGFNMRLFRQGQKSENFTRLERAQRQRGLHAVNIWRSSRSLIEPAREQSWAKLQLESNREQIRRLLREKDKNPPPFKLTKNERAQREYQLAKEEDIKQRVERARRIATSGQFTFDPNVLLIERDIYEKGEALARRFPAPENKLRVRDSESLDFGASLRKVRHWSQEEPPPEPIDAESDFSERKSYTSEEPPPINWEEVDSSGPATHYEPNWHELEETSVNRHEYAGEKDIQGFQNITEISKSDLHPIPEPESLKSLNDQELAEVYRKTEPTLEYHKKVWLNAKSEESPDVNSYREGYITASQHRAAIVDELRTRGYSFEQIASGKLESGPQENIDSQPGEEDPYQSDWTSKLSNEELLSEYRRTYKKAERLKSQWLRAKANKRAYARHRWKWENTISNRHDLWKEIINRGYDPEEVSSFALSAESSPPTPDLHTDEERAINAKRSGRRRVEKYRAAVKSGKTRSQALADQGLKVPENFGLVIDEYGEVHQPGSAGAFSYRLRTALDDSSEKTASLVRFTEERDRRSLILRGRSIGLEAVQAAMSGGFEGQESDRDRLKTLLSRARNKIYSTIREEIDTISRDDIAGRKRVDELQRMAESVVNEVVGAAAEMVGAEASIGELARENRSAMVLPAAGQKGFIESLYNVDTRFKEQVDRAGGIDRVLRSGGIFDSGSGKVNIRGADDGGFDRGGRGGGLFGRGGGGEGGYGSTYGPIRMWYAMRALSGTIGMAYGNAITDMSRARDFDATLAGVAGSESIISERINRLQNMQLRMGIAAGEQYGFIVDAGSEVLGRQGTARVAQSLKSGIGIGFSGLVANSLLELGGFSAFPGLGQFTMAVGGAYIGASLLNELYNYASGQNVGLGDRVGGWLGISSIPDNYYANFREKWLDSADRRGWNAESWAATKAAVSQALPNRGGLFLWSLPESRRLNLFNYLSSDDAASDSSLWKRPDITSNVSIPSTKWEELTREEQDFVDYIARVSGITRGEVLRRGRGVITLDEQLMQYEEDFGVPADQAFASALKYAQSVNPLSPEAQMRAIQTSDLFRDRDTMRELSTWQQSTLQLREGLAPYVGWSGAQDIVNQRYSGLRQEDYSLTAPDSYIASITNQYDVYALRSGRTASPSFARTTRALLESGQITYGQAESHAKIYESLSEMGFTPDVSYNYIPINRPVWEQQSLFGLVEQSYKLSGTPFMLRDIESLSASGYATHSAYSKLMQTAAALGGDLESLFGLGSPKSTFGGFFDLSEVQQGMVPGLMEDLFTGDIAETYSGVSGMLSGLDVSQSRAAAGLAMSIKGTGISSERAMQLARMGSLRGSIGAMRYEGIASSLISLGAEPGQAWSFALPAQDLSAIEYRDTMGALRGDEWSISALRQRGSTILPSLPRATVDVTTGLSLFHTSAGGPFGGQVLTQEDVWGLEDQQHALQYQNQLFGLNMRREQLQQSRAMTFGGSFVNPITGQTQTIQYGRQDISDALWNISVEQQRYNLQYQERQLGLSNEYQREQMQSNYQQQLTRWQWRVEDWQYGENVNQLQFAWQMEDFDENIRFARGRQRFLLMRQRDRAVISETMRRGHSEEQRERMDQEREWLEERHRKQEEYFRSNRQLQEERLQKEREFFQQRTMWQERQRNLERMSAELQFNRQQREINHQSAVIQQQEVIYWKMKDIDRERIRVQGEIQTWLKNLPDQLDIFGGSAGTSSGSGAMGQVITMLSNINAVLQSINNKGGGSMYDRTYQTFG